MIKRIPNASLFPYNTFGMDVKAALLIEYDTAAELSSIFGDQEVQSLMKAESSKGHLPFWHIGGGSNLLFMGDYPGLVLHCTARGIEELVISSSQDPDSCLLSIDAGTTWDDVCAYCAERELYGTENLSLIPGETGAAAVQNIGAYGVEIKDLIHEVRCWDVVDDCPHAFNNQEMSYGYRDSLLKHTAMKERYVVLKVVIKVSRKPHLNLGYAGLRTAVGDTPGITAQLVRDTVISIRESKLPDPHIMGNAGSFFKNPVVDNLKFAELLALYPTMPHYTVDAGHTKIPAGWMIEQCGWKGKSLGRAGVYEKQSLVLVNRGGATPDEIVKLCNTVVHDVELKFGIRIYPEVNLIEC